MWYHDKTQTRFLIDTVQSECMDDKFINVCSIVTEAMLLTKTRILWFMLVIFCFELTLFLTVYFIMFSDHYRAGSFRVAQNLHWYCQALGYCVLSDSFVTHTHVFLLGFICSARQGSATSARNQFTLQGIVLRVPSVTTAGNRVTLQGRVLRDQSVTDVALRGKFLSLWIA